jgi:hypothetical protein
VPLQILPPVHALPQTPQFSLLLRVTHLLEQHVWFAEQQAALHASCPPQSRQALPLHAPLEQLVTGGAGHWPLALQTSAAVIRPPEQVCPAPHAVPGGLLVVSVHTCCPVEHTYAAFLHGLVVEVQGSPCLQSPHIPL